MTKKITVLIFLQVNMLFLYSCVYYRTALEEEYRIQAERLYSERDYQESLQYYEKIREITRNNYARYRIAELQIRVGKFEEARNHIDALLRRDRANILVQELDAFWYSAVNDNITALEKYKALNELEPYNIRILSNIGILYDKIGEYVLALEYFNTVLEVSVLSPDVLGTYIHSLREMIKDNKEDEKGERAENIQQEYLSMLIHTYTSSFQKGEISFFNMFDSARMVRDAFPHYSFSLFSTILKFKEQARDDESKKIVAQSGVIISQIMLNKEYIPQDVDYFELVLTYLGYSLEYGYGRTLDEQEQLNALLTIVDTTVLYKRILRLYMDYYLISQIRYDALIENPIMNTTTPIDEPIREEDL